MTEQLQDENKLIAERRAKLDQIRKNCPANGHPNDFQREHLAADLQAEFGEHDKDALVALGKTVSVAGRIMAKRGPFLALQDMTGRIQAYATKEAQQIIKAQYAGLDIGDIVGVTGILHKSGKGDLYVNMDQFQLLTKALRPLPEKFHGLSDQETRYRQRYLDLITNDDSRRTFQVRSQVMAAIRQFMNGHGFMEVETPMMQVIPGGASARPFITHHNALDMDMYLRIAPELYLKRLVVGGFEKVFEINRNFRNEGLSPRHNPEFTMMEFYWAYADYRDLMDFTEEMLRTVTTQVLGSPEVKYGEETFDFGKPFERLSMKNAILKYNPEVTLDQLATFESACEVAKDLKIKIEKSWGLGRVITEIFEETAEHRLIQPTFITEYPEEVSPLARRNDTDPTITDRFEFFIGGREIANGFSELNDAEDQAQRFRDQVNQKDAGDDEAMFYDEDYVTSLEHGLPPTAGQGIGIDRLVMLLTDSHTIRDVILFPTLRPQR
ncbi:lysine--tRNA ligase [Oceanisphaera arctica]|uniref:Lysine--tRNA ligase n=1 Tax=Oceanisphaera arctica TaxID=641510 RepID=A0A2P5TP50_9GAMM|nr:lysine--tRNA ligase [Oceanisphaera arctica]PPL17418.1 lysine--tRNA ligase [Oceanisphaera arctica]GHA08178.1 lysine--tRNA ligase [Oceanisphaera arctica]